MSKKFFDENLQLLGLPDKVAFNAMVDLTPDTLLYKEEMIEVMECVPSSELVDFIDATHPTDLALAFRSIRTD